MDNPTLESLKNRRVLLEKEISFQKSICAKMYLNQMSLHQDHALVYEYDRELFTLTRLQDELKHVNSFIGE